MADDKTLSDVLMLLTKVSSKLGDRVEKLEKMIGNARKDKRIEDQQAAAKKESKQEDGISALTKMLKLKFDDEQKKPEEVVDKKQEVIITDFGRDATKTLVQALGGRLPSKDRLEKTGSKPEDESIFSKVAKFLPAIGIALGALGGLLSSLMSGKFGEFWEKIKAGKFSEAWDSATQIIYQTLGPILKSLPIIGPILSIKDGMEEFNKGNVVGGLKNLVQGVLGLLPLPIPVKAAIIGVVEMLGTWIEGKVGKEQIPTGSGGDIMAGAMKAVALVMKPLIKRLPLVGSLISFYEAYEAFQMGGATGISKGILNLASGIANLVPGYGTAIAIGLDVISAFLFTEKEETVDGKKVKKIDTRDWFKKTIDFITNSFPIRNFIMFGEGIGDIINGDYMEGFTKMADAVPVFSFFMDLARGLGSETVRAQSKGGSMTDFLEGVVNSVLMAVVNTLPKTFGIRYAAAKMLGVTGLEGMPTPEDEAKRLGLTQKQFDVKQAAEKKEDAEQKEKQSQTTAGTNAMLGMGYKANDFIKTSDGKLIIPHKDDTLIGLKTDGPLDKFFKNNIKSTEEGNTILKKYAEVSSNIMEKQLRLLDENNKLLNALAKNMSTPANVISKPTVITNNFSSSNSLRSLQGAPAY